MRKKIEFFVSLSIFAPDKDAIAMKTAQAKRR
jgi:hypothetical protein